MDDFSFGAARLLFDVEHKNDELLNGFDFEVSSSETAWSKFVEETKRTPTKKFGGKRRAFGKFVRSNSVPVVSNDADTLDAVASKEEISIPRRSPSPSPPPFIEPKVDSTFRVIEQPPRPSKNIRSMSMFELSPRLEEDYVASPVRCLSQNDEGIYEYFNTMHESAPVGRYPHQRSASMLGSSTTANKSLRRCSSLQVNHSLPDSSMNNDENHWRINTRETMLDQTPDKLERDRKKIRARRHSIQGHMEPLSERITLAVSALRSPPSNLVSDLSWLVQKPKQEQPLEFDLLEASEVPEISTPDRSLSSTRKRGVCGTPIEADMSMSLLSTAGSSIRRRSLVLIPEDSQGFPMIPNIRLQDSARNLEVESEDDDDDDSMDHSRDTSFHSADSQGETEKMLDEDDLADRCCEPDHILDNMTTFEDLKYLVKMLQNQSKIQISFGSNSWTVTPRSSWPKSRSSEFIKWARAQFGFASHSIDGSTSYLQIQKTHGRQILQQIEAAVRVYETRECCALQKISEDNQMKESPLFSRSSVERTKGSLFSRSSLATPLTLNSPVVPTIRCDATDELVAGLSSLSVHDSRLLRTVTLEPRDEQHLSKARASFDNHTPTDDLLQSLHGYRHAEQSIVRPPRPSFGHDCCSVFKPERLSVAATHDIGNNDFFGTPMNQDVCWGSRPLPGRDWGCSEACKDDVLSRLACLFEQREAGWNRDSATSSSSTTSRSSNLAFDLGSCVEDDVLVDIAPSELDHQDGGVGEISRERNDRRRRASMVKNARMSLFLKTSDQESSRLSNHRPIFWSKRSSVAEIIKNDLKVLGHARFPGEVATESHAEDLFENQVALVHIFSFLSQTDLMTTASTVCSSWSDAATTAIVKLMRSSLDFLEDEDEPDDNSSSAIPSSSLEQSWDYLTGLFPWGRFLSYGAFKNVYRVHNAATDNTEAVSVMDINKIIDKKTILAELSVSVMLSSLARRAICPNFITLRGVFSCPHAPAPTHWGTMTRKAPLGDAFIPGKIYKPPKKPKQAYSGRYVYIRMELCNQGDAEEFLKKQAGEIVDTTVAQAIAFQTAFALYAAADKFSVKHYDMKLLNIFLHSPKTKRNLVLRYGLGSHTFAINMPAEHALIAKVADYGTANIRPDSNGQPVTIAQFTTLENTPPDFMILGDMAKQGHAHDCFGMGLCMLHLFTGHAPYEEILEKVKCPPGFKKRLRNIWENENEKGYDIIRSVILTDVYKDDAGNVIDGEPDETLYDTLYRFLVLFGIPDVQFESKRCPKVWKAIHESFSPTQNSGKPARGNQSDASTYRRHCNSFSVRHGSNEYIARARKGLMSMNGGMELLFKLCSFDPATRATALEVLNSPFMANLAEVEGSTYHPDDTVHSFTSFSTHR